MQNCARIQNKFGTVLLLWSENSLATQHPTVLLYKTPTVLLHYKRHGDKSPIPVSFEFSSLAGATPQN